MDTDDVVPGSGVALEPKELPTLDAFAQAALDHRGIVLYGQVEELQEPPRPLLGTGWCAPSP